MELQRKNKELYIDKEAIAVLSLAEEGLLYPVEGLMNEEEALEVKRYGLYKGRSYPCPLLLSPSGRRNEEVLKNAKKGDVIDFITDGVHTGRIIVNSVFKIDKKKRVLDITGNDFSEDELEGLEARIGEWSVCGEYRIKNNDLGIYKENLSQKINQSGAKRVVGMMLNAAPLHRVHEKIMREAIGRNDLLVIFLLRPYRNNFINYDLKLKCIQFLVDNYLMKEKIVIVPLDDTYIYAGQNRMILNAIVAKNFGCTHMIVGENNKGLSVYYLNNQVHSIFDNLRGVNLEIDILPEYVYCDMCKTLVSVRTCPHGHHHHINYNSQSFIEFFRLGLLPPTMLVRRQISSIMLSDLFPNRFKNIDRLYYDILPSNGIIQNSGEEEFYLKLMELYQTTSLN